MKIAICGKMTSGKTYISNKLAQKYNLEIYSFARGVKKIAKELFNMNYKDRLLLQNLAQKMKEINENVWINYLDNIINKKKNIIIDDLRFPNELKYLRKNNFIIIRLKISKEEQKKRLKIKYKNYNNHIKGINHESELNIENLKVDYEVISNEKTFDKIINFLSNHI